MLIFNLVIIQTDIDDDHCRKGEFVVAVLYRILLRLNKMIVDTQPHSW